MVGPALIVTVNGFDPVLPSESVTNTVNVNGLPDVVLGVPLTVPAVESVNPGGSVPADTVHEYGLVPPVAASVVVV